jgi:uncharacterized membrane protein YfcA
MGMGETIAGGPECHHSSGLNLDRPGGRTEDARAPFPLLEAENVPPISEIGLLYVVGCAAGFVNVVAGGGSLLTLPTLIFLGLPSSVANATNRIGLILQNVVATSTFQRRNRLKPRLALRLTAFALPGAVVGARIALEIDETWFRRILAVVLVLALVPILRSKKPREEPAERPPHPRWLDLSFVLMGLYAGFLQAGLGFLLIAALTQLGGLDLIRSNAVKVAVVLVLQIAALALFQFVGAVDWGRGICLALGSMTGAYLAARWQIRSGVVWVRRLLMLIVVLMAIRLVLASS